MSDLVEQPLGETSPVVRLTDEARTKIVEVRSAEPDAENLGLWIEVSGEANGAYTYTMELRPLEDAAAEGVVQRHDDLSVVIDHDSVEKLSGATLDFTGAGMVMKNPNQPAPAPAWGADRPAPDLTGELPQKVLAILDTEINPAIAAHGGYAELVAVDDNVVYVRMGGGCQGCGMAAVTLSQGIEVAILEGVPEIERVVDVTDHASGSNPYYEAAKK
jgi:Fe/S biogenesis protein NfuA